MAGTCPEQFLFDELIEFYFVRSPTVDERVVSARAVNRLHAVACTSFCHGQCMNAWFQFCLHLCNILVGFGPMSLEVDFYSEAIFGAWHGLNSGVRGCT